MRNLFLPLFTAFFIPLFLVSQGPETFINRKRLNEKSGRPESVYFNAGSGLSVNADFAKFNGLLGLKAFENLVFKRSQTDELGMVHTRYTQTANGFPVFGGEMIFHEQFGEIKMINGHLYDVPNLNPSLSEGQALILAKALYPGSIFRWELSEEEQYLKEETNNPSASWFPHGSLEFAPRSGNFEIAEFHLCWKFDIYTFQPEKREIVYVDALNGEVIFRHTQIHSADANGTAVTKFSGTKNITTDSTAVNSFRLRESGRGGGIRTRNCQTTTNTTSAVDFTDANNYWNNVNANIDEAATDGHYGAEMFYDYFMSAHSRNSFNGSGEALRVYVHYDDSYDNATFNGTYAVFGDGSNNQPFTTIDIVAHEFTHGVVGTTAGLVYQNESGALNESFCDIFGNCVEQYGNPTTADLRMGEARGAIRDMADPTAFSNPDTYKGRYWVFGTGDNGGVHTNSGVQNYWFALLVNGGSGTNDNNNAFTVASIGMTKAAKIAYRNLDVYLTSSSDYRDTWEYSVTAAGDLYGACSPEQQEVMNAWYACGIGSPYNSTLTPAFTNGLVNFCTTPATVQFTNQSIGAVAYTWQFGDGTQSTLENPLKTYQISSTYNVTLVVYACDGSSQSLTVPNLVNINSLNPCQFLAVNNDTLDIEECGGVIFDTGGPTGNYLDNNTSLIRIQPPGAQSISLNFISFSFNGAGDYIKVFDGPSDQSPLIGTYGGATLPNGGTINSTGGAITISDNSNGANNGPGYEIHYSCAVGREIEYLNSIKVFPNPAHSSLQLVSDQKLDGATFEIMDAVGKIIQQGMVKQNLAIELGNMGSGLYFIQLNQGGKTFSTRFIKE